MGFSQRAMTVATLVAAVALVPVGAVAAPPANDDVPGQGHGANPGHGQGGANPGQGHGVSSGQGQGGGNPGQGHGNGGNSGQGNGANSGTGNPGHGNGGNPGHGNGGNSGGGNSGHGNGGNSGHGNGANQPGPYDPNGVGRPSGNGNSEHNNGNRPCAGCVGNADDKNPPGQLPGGSDGNAGYECDRNQGVGKTNPAHSGCGPAAPPEEPPGGEPPNQPPGGEPPEQPPSGGPPKQPPSGGPPEQPPSGGPPQQPPSGGPSDQPPGGGPEGAVQTKQRGVVLAKQEERGAPAAEGAQEAPEGRPVSLSEEETAGLPFTGGRTLLLLALGVLALAIGLCARRFGVRRET
jgi:hypothetical protein